MTILSMFPTTSKPDTPPDGTALPIENIEDWFVPQPVPELDEGNEIYFLLVWNLF